MIDDNLNADNWDVSEGMTRMLPDGLLLSQHQVQLIQPGGRLRKGWSTVICRMGGPSLYSESGLDRADGERRALAWWEAWRRAGGQ